MATRNLLGPTTAPTTTLSPQPSAAEIPDSIDDCQIPTTASSDNPECEDPDPTRERERNPKRRRYRPKALEKIEELLIAPNSNPNFSFDTNFAACSPEITPKFGSFNLVVLNSDQKNRKCKEEEEEEGEGEDQERSWVNVSKTQTGSSSVAVQETK